MTTALTRPTVRLGTAHIPVRVRRRDIDAAIALCAHDPLAARAYADAQAQHLPQRLAACAGHFQLAYSYARQAHAAELAATELAGGVA